MKIWQSIWFNERIILNSYKKWKFLIIGDNFDNLMLMW